MVAAGIADGLERWNEAAWVVATSGCKVVKAGTKMAPDCLPLEDERSLR